MTPKRASTTTSYPDCSTHRQRTPAESHGHSHGLGAHHHHHHHSGAGLKGALIITAIFLVAEIIGGLASNSLTLLADAGHMATDVGALAFSLFVAWLSRQPATQEKSYGYLRWEILAALLNGATLLAISAAIVWEAIVRFQHPEPVATGIMFWVAVAGFVANAVSARLLHAGAEHSLNVRGAYLHILGDLLGSAAAIVAALLIRYKGWTIADPIASIVMTVMIIRGSWSLVKESVDILLEATPDHIDPTAVRASLVQVPAVASVHDLHIWTLTSGVIAMSAHAVVSDPARNQEALEAMTAAVAAYGIHHVTIQIEGRSLAACAPEHVHA